MTDLLAMAYEKFVEKNSRKRPPPSISAIKSQEKLVPESPLASILKKGSNSELKQVRLCDISEAEDEALKEDESLSVDVKKGRKEYSELEKAKLKEWAKKAIQRSNELTSVSFSKELFHANIDLEKEFPGRQLRFLVKKARELLNMTPITE